METIQLTIPNMKSPHRQVTVTNAIRAIGGNIRAIAPTKAEVELSNNLSKETVIQTIKKAGHNVL